MFGFRVYTGYLLPSSAGACQIRKIRAIVRIDKVPTRRVWRVYVDRFHPANVRLLEEFQYFETVTFDEQVMACVESLADSSFAGMRVARVGI